MGLDELKSLESWSHFLPVVLKAGRCTHAAPAGMGEEEREEYLAKMNESDKPEDPLRSISEDKPLPGVGPSWTSKVMGDA